MTLIASIDAGAADGDFPWWDDAKRLTCAMRATGLRANERIGLVFEQIAYVPSEAALERSVYAYGDVAAAGVVSSDWLTGDGAFVSSVDDQTLLVKATGVRFQPGRQRATTPTISPPRLTVELAGRKRTVEVKLDGVPAAQLCKLSPSEVAAIVLVEECRNELFVARDELPAIVGLHGAETLFTFDDWQHPSAADEAASASRDLVAMSSALEAGAKPTLTGRANGTPKHWLKDIAALRGTPDLGWGGTWAG